MNSFKVDDAVEALDEFGVWARGTIVAIEGEDVRVSFDGFGSQWDLSTSLNEERIRPGTVIELPNKRSRQPQIADNLKRLQSGDKVTLDTGEVSIVQVDPIRGKLIVELKDGERKEVLSNELCCQTTDTCTSKAKAARRKGKCNTKAKKRKSQTTLDELVTDHQDELPVVTNQFGQGQDKEEETETGNCLFIYFVRDDGMWLRVGDIVSVEGVGLPFIICRMSYVDGRVTAKLVNIHNSGLREDFVITCSVSYIVFYSGGKVNLKALEKGKVEQDAYVEFCNFMSSGVSSGVQVNMRKLVLGHAMRLGLQGGFGNLNSIRLSLGPSDILLDNKIFNFLCLKGECKFSVMGDGEFEFLDTIMGKGWDYKMGRGEDAFFKFITEIQVKRSHDICLSVVAKFSQSQFVFSPLYRVECRKAVKEGREQMENIVL